MTKEVQRKNSILKDETFQRNIGKLLGRDNFGAGGQILKQASQFINTYSAEVSKKIFKRNFQSNITETSTPDSADDGDDNDDDDDDSSDHENQKRDFQTNIAKSTISLISNPSPITINSKEFSNIIIHVLIENGGVCGDSNEYALKAANIALEGKLLKLKKLYLNECYREYVYEPLASTFLTQKSTSIENHQTSLLKIVSEKTNTLAEQSSSDIVQSEITTTIRNTQFTILLTSESVQFSTTTANLETFPESPSPVFTSESPVITESNAILSEVVQISTTTTNPEISSESPSQVVTSESPVITAKLYKYSAEDENTT
ncbi:hypothetical protein HK096_008100, partial [Nowakowskiella sp. JEL0078]